MTVKGLKKIESRRELHEAIGKLTVDEKRRIIDEDRDEPIYNFLIDPDDYIFDMLWN